MLKYSKQRESIKNFLVTRYDHPTAETVYLNIRREFNPIPACVRINASGMREPVRITLIVLDNLVRPSPDNAPTVISSMDIKTSLNPIMTR